MTLFNCFVLAWISGLFCGFSLSLYLPAQAWLLIWLPGIPVFFLAISRIRSPVLSVLTVVMTGFLLGGTYQLIRFPDPKSDTLTMDQRARVIHVRDWGEQAGKVVVETSHPRLRLLLTLRGEARDSVFLRMGDLVFLRHELIRMQGPSRVGEFQEKNFWAAYGARYQTTIWKASLKTERSDTPSPWHDTPEKLRKAFLLRISGMGLDARNQALLVGMLTGDKQFISAGDKELFSAVGMMHLLAVSGLHVGLVFALFSWFLQLLGLARVHPANRVTSTLMVWGYAVFCGLPASALRAAGMLTIYALLKLCRRRTRSIHVVFAMCMLHTLIQPTAIYSVGFQLSYLAVTGILVFYPQMKKLWRTAPKLVARITDLALISLSAQVFTWPLVIWYFGRFPVWFLLSNILLAPFGILIFYLTLVLLAFSVLTGIPAWLAAGLNVLVSLWIAAAELLKQLPPGVLEFNQLPVATVLVFFLLVGLMKRGLHYRLQYPAPLLILLVLWSIYGFFNNFVANYRV